MGIVDIPEWAFWGAQTQRARDNFNVSPLLIPPAMITALAWIKKHAALANCRLELLSPRLANAIEQTCDEIIAGKWDAHFPVDVFQTGSGTSWNMNINEVVANRANQILGSPIGSRSPVHPNDHVNKGQSSNDVIPTALHIADRIAAQSLLDDMLALRDSLLRKSEEFTDVVKLGRTHLQDAVPMTLGQEFSGYASQIQHCADRLKGCFPDLEELALGGTALGTGINTHPDFATIAIEGIAKETGKPFRAAANRFEAIAARDAQVALMGVLNGIAVAFMKIANDLRLLSSGPRGALGEIIIPSLQPGSSIMPGKINPVIPEMVIQVAASVIGKASTVSIAGQNSPLELNMMLPLIAYETIFSLLLLQKTAATFARRCIDGITADRERCEYWIAWSMALVTPVAKRIGYDRAAAIAYKAYREKRLIRDVLREELEMSPEAINEMLAPEKMIANHSDG